jgi:hypothetical protein
VWFPSVRQGWSSPVADDVLVTFEAKGPYGDLRVNLSPEFGKESCRDVNSCFEVTLGTRHLCSLFTCCHTISGCCYSSGMRCVITACGMWLDWMGCVQGATATSSLTSTMRALCGLLSAMATCWALIGLRFMFRWYAHLSRQQHTHTHTHTHTHVYTHTHIQMRAFSPDKFLIHTDRCIPRVLCLRSLNSCMSVAPLIVSCVSLSFNLTAQC